MKFRSYWGLLSITLIAFTSCHPEPPVSDLVQNMAVQTNYDKTAAFSKYTTYAMPLDSIGQIYNADPGDTLITGDYATLITNTVKSNIDARGYTHVARTQSPDLSINVFVVRDYQVFQTVSYPGFYGGYPGYYYPSYYGYGGYYGYPYVSTYASQSGTLIIEAVDLNSRDINNNVNVVWTAYIGDVISSVDRNTKTKEAIDQAFRQSAYFRK
ncbi:MAG TPA: DUF4136 domain-containing protein [Cyclobacteriaceae bacterium]|nr:DUF4136 domain-containing protein [Cyclobacteriaceae bacterium]